MEFTRRGGQHDMAGTPPGRLQRSHGDEVAVERSGRLPRYKPDCLHIKHQTSNIKHRRLCGSNSTFNLFVASSFRCFFRFSSEKGSATFRVSCVPRKNSLVRRSTHCWSNVDGFCKIAPP